jgi:hypothetical protein
MTRATSLPGVLTFTASLSLLASASLVDAQGALKAPRISGPLAHDNLQVFLIHGAAAAPGQKFLTLQEAMEKKQVVVHETGNVNELSVENLSPTLAIFIHAGDIVKGGRQDRTIPQDVLLPPSSGIVPLSSFCVESGRWSARGSEPAAQFNSSNDMLVGRGLKIAARKAADQSQVWAQVSKAQEALGSVAGAPVADAASPSSLQLTLQNPKVQKSAEAYVQALNAAAKETDLVGCAFAVNGQIRSAEVYASPDLFRKMWPKLLKSAAVEATAGATDIPIRSTLTSGDVRAFMTSANEAKEERRDLSARERLVTRENEKVLLFETQDRQKKDAVLHRSYVAK